MIQYKAYHNRTTDEPFLKVLSESEIESVLFKVSPNFALSKYEIINCMKKSLVGIKKTKD